MDAFEYIITLISIIVGLGITHLFVGISRLINNTKGVKIYWIHLLWSFYIFIYLISFWWFEYKFASLQEWSFQVYLFLILYAVILFFLCVLNMPYHFPEDFKTYFFSNRKWFFAALIVTNGIDVFDSIMKGGEYVSELGAGYIIFMVITTLLLALGFISRKVLVQAAVVILVNLYQLGFLLINFKSL